MSHSRRTTKKIEFNKRVRDIVSRDSNQLRKTFEKFDKEYASRLAEIQNMQEKVRHSMRNLAQERMQMRPNSEIANFQRGARREGEVEGGKSVHDDRREGSTMMFDNKLQSSVEERIKSNSKASLPGIHNTRSEHLEVPNRASTRVRRFSLPHPPTFLPGGPKESRAFPIHASLPRTGISSSLPREAFVKPSSPKDTLRRKQLQSSETARQRRTDRLSVNDLPISSSRSDYLTSAKGKLSPQLGRKILKVENSLNDKDINSDPDEENKPDQVKSLGNSEITSGSDTPLKKGDDREPKGVIDHNNTRPKILLTRTRSSSLPCDPSQLKDIKLKENLNSDVSEFIGSANHVVSGKRVSSAALPIATHWKENEPVSGPFDELRYCRYLRSSDVED